MYIYLYDCIVIDRLKQARKANKSHPSMPNRRASVLLQVEKLEVVVQTSRDNSKEQNECSMMETEDKLSHALRRQIKLDREKQEEEAEQKKIKMDVLSYRINRFFDRMLLAEIQYIKHPRRPKDDKEEDAYLYIPFSFMPDLYFHPFALSQVINQGKDVTRTETIITFEEDSKPDKDEFLFLNDSNEIGSTFYDVLYFKDIESSCRLALRAAERNKQKLAILEANSLGQEVDSIDRNTVTPTPRSWTPLLLRDRVDWNSHMPRVLTTELNAHENKTLKKIEFSNDRRGHVTAPTAPCIVTKENALLPGQTQLVNLTSDEDHAHFSLMVNEDSSAAILSLVFFIDA
jgi:hypothetical protein